jgi:hypothetical protein
MIKKKRKKKRARLEKNTHRNIRHSFNYHPIGGLTLGSQPSEGRPEIADVYPLSGISGLPV